MLGNWSNDRKRLVLAAADTVPTPSSSFPSSALYSSCIFTSIPVSLPLHMSLLLLLILLLYSIRCFFSSLQTVSLWHLPLQLLSLSPVKFFHLFKRDVCIYTNYGLGNRWHAHTYLGLHICTNDYVV